MKRLLKLYPKVWRERYGDEFEALLEERQPGLLDSVDIVRGALDARWQAGVHARRNVQQRGNGMSLHRDEMRDELRAMLAAREELGPVAEEHLVEQFLDLLEARSIPTRRQPSTVPRIRQLPMILRWLSALLVLWMLAGISSIALGFPWSLGSTAPAYIFAAAVMSGYAAVLILLVFAVCMALLALLVARFVRGSNQLDYHPRT